MDPAMMSDGGGIYNFAEIWNGLHMNAAATPPPYGLVSDSMVLDQGSILAPTNQDSTKRLAESDVAIHSNNIAMSEGNHDNVSNSKRLKAVGSDVNREKNRIRDCTPVEPVDWLKQDYIHVRARRGQATDNHSLAERARREKISERMKALQDLVPGCNRVIGKALVLDEIINYIQSLQRQVEFLSMKLEAINVRVGTEGSPPKDGSVPNKNPPIGGGFGRTS